MHWQTPLLRADPANGCQWWLKMECWQPTGSFKIRGLGHLARHAAQHGARRLVASSGGNAGLAVAYAARELGLASEVFVPRTTVDAVCARLADMGAAVTVVGEVWDETDRVAQAHARPADACYMPPFDHPLVWEGHAGMIAECARQGPRPDAVVVAVGGGGLMCGVLQGMHTAGWQDVPLVACETEGAASLRAALQAGEPVALDAIDTLATSLGARRVAAACFAWTQAHRVESVVVTDAAALQASLRFVDRYRTLVELACGAALAGAAEVQDRYRRLLVIVCGGVGVSLAQLLSWRAEIFGSGTSDPCTSGSDVG